MEGGGGGGGEALAPSLLPALPLPRELTCSQATGQFDEELERKKNRQTNDMN